MASPLPTRRVLSPLNVNSPITKGLGDFDAQNSNSLTKPRPLGESILLQTSAGSMSEKAHGEALVAGEKRSSDAHEDEKQILSNTPSSRKRFKTVHSATAGLSLDESRHGPSQNHGSEEQDGGRVRVYKDDLRHDRSNENAGPSSPASSQASSAQSLPSAYSSPNVLNDSQQTVLTEPDDAPLPAAASFGLPGSSTATTDLSSLSKDELRERANALRLRLRLASYKVRTNQINIPLDRLQIRTTSSSPNFNSRRTTPKRTPLPTTALPNIQLQQPSAEKKQHSIPSSPPTHQSPQKEKDDEALPRDGLATPLLPRQREGLLNPPNLGTPLARSGGNTDELTSSVVKGRAAEGLLGLMRQNS